MIRHLVLFKLNEGVSRDEPRTVAGAKAFSELGALVPGVASWECAWNVSERPNAYDFAINSSFPDRAALQSYSDHADHQAAVSHWREFATWVIADYEF